MLLVVFFGTTAAALSSFSKDLSKASARVDKQYSNSLQKAAVLVQATGCWAGREYRFSRLTGEPLALENIPEELAEWSTYYSYETFVREERTAIRTTYLVEPEAGCAADEGAVSPRSSGVDLDDALPLLGFRRRTLEVHQTVGVDRGERFAVEIVGSPKLERKR
mgnify:CR=1 FL=1